jgi:hypothetical protein
MKRSIIIQDLADEPIATLTISEIQRVNIAAKLIHFNEKPDKTWKLVHSASLFTNLPDVKVFEFMNFNVVRGNMNPEAEIILRGLGVKLNVVRASPVVGSHRYLHLDHDTHTDTWKLLYHSTLIEDLTLVGRLAVQIKD